MIGFSTNATKNIKTAVASGALLLALTSLNPLSAGANEMANAADGKWLAGDFHQHTFYTDGSTPFFFVMQENYAFGLDWWTNSEHGGGRNRDGEGRFWDDPAVYPKNPVQGDYATSNGRQVMWRWQSLRDFAYADIIKTRSIYSGNQIFSGLEWNVPAHEHCSVGVLGKDAAAVSAFEFMFDKSDADTSRTGEATPFGSLKKSNGKTYSWPNGVKQSASKSFPDGHADAVAATAWMEKQYRRGLIDDAWIIFAHIERDGAWTENGGGGYNVEHFRDFNNAAPHIAFGFEGAPGHQVNHWRGFGNEVTIDANNMVTSGDFGGSYGGVGYYTAKVGGLWDALLGEGRHFFNFANSDYHEHYTAGGDDFYPGEYQKTWVYAQDLDGDGKHSLKEIAEGLRSGNSFFVMGDLINHLEFSAWQNTNKASMGENLTARSGKNKPVRLQIKFNSPDYNNNGPTPAVDHIDLIAGEITGKIAPTDPNYTKATNDTTKVIARFTSKDWKIDADGNKVIDYAIDLNKSMYFRLRGTNIAVSTAFETDAEGNPLADALATDELKVDGADEAWKDLWFYSNPIFVYVK